MIDIDTTEKKYLRSDEFCEYFRMSKSTFYQWVNEGKIKVRPRNENEHIRIPIEEAKRFKIEGPRSELE